MQITEGGQIYDLNFNPTQTFSGKSFQLAPDGGGGTYLFLAQVTSVASGQAVSNTVVASDTVQDLYGTATSTTVGNSSYQDVFSGGTASATAIGSGGTQTVYSSGTDLNATVNGGNQYILSGGKAIGTLITAGGNQVVSSGGIATGATVGSGGQDVYGTASTTVIGSGGVQVVEAGATATGTTVNSGGGQDVYGTASATTIAVVALRSSNPAPPPRERQSAAAPSRMSTARRSTTRSTAEPCTSATVASGGVQYVSAGGTAIGATVSSGGTQNDVGTASGTTVLNGGHEIVTSGGFASATTLSGGTLEIASGGSAGAILFGDSGTLQLEFADGVRRHHLRLPARRRDRPPEPRLHQRHDHSVLESADLRRQCQRHADGDQRCNGRRDPDPAGAILDGEFQRHLGRPGRHADHRSAGVQFRNSDGFGRAPVIGSDV